MEHTHANPTSDNTTDGLIPAGRPLPLSAYLRELWLRRDFMIRVPLEELRAQNAHTLLGGIWLILNPLLQVGVYFLVFGVIMPIDRGVDDYLMFLTIGVFVFFYSQRIISEAARSVVVNLGLIRTLRFPRATLPLSATVGQTMAFIPALTVMAAVVAAHSAWPHPRWLLIPALLALQIAFSLGAGFLAARYNHTYRDLENLLPFVFRLAFYVSGVLYRRPLHRQHPRPGRVPRQPLLLLCDRLALGTGRNTGGRRDLGGHRPMVDRHPACGLRPVSGP